MPTNGAKSATKPEGGPDDQLYLPSLPFQPHQWLLTTTIEYDGDFTALQLPGGCENEFWRTWCEQWKLPSRLQSQALSYRPMSFSPRCQYTNSTNRYFRVSCMYWVSQERLFFCVVARCSGLVVVALVISYLPAWEPIHDTPGPIMELFCWNLVPL